MRRPLFGGSELGCGLFLVLESSVASGFSVVGGTVVAAAVMILGRLELDGFVVDLWLGEGWRMGQG